jgi:hypothetical protein
VALLLLLGACGGDESDRNPAALQAPRPTLPAELLALYDYDASAPIAFQEKSVDPRDGATVHDISFAGPKGR